ncbi:MAG: aromatic acid exporter family protein [Aerococcaceae bacterium]|nr:aromatic acid exporter family protein [Aerococcaceae bacterium]
MSTQPGWHALKIGLRTTKTVIAVGVTLTLFEWWNRQPAMLAALSAVYSMQQSHETSVNYGKFRIFGNTIGVVVAILIARLGLLISLDPSVFRVLASMLGVLLIIVICNALNLSTSIINSTATFFVVLLNTPSMHLWDYGANRILDTIIGAIIGILINYLLPNHHTE